MKNNDLQKNELFYDCFIETSDKIKISFLKQLLEKNVELQNQFIAFTDSKKIMAKLELFEGEKIDTIKEEIHDELSTLDIDDFVDEDYYDRFGCYDDSRIFDNVCDVIEEIIKSYIYKAEYHLSNGNPIDSFKVILGVFEGSQNLPELDSMEIALFNGEYNSNVQEILGKVFVNLAKTFEETVISDEHIFKMIDMFEERYKISIKENIINEENDDAEIVDEFEKFDEDEEYDDDDEFDEYDDDDDDEEYDEFDDEEEYIDDDDEEDDKDLDAILEDKSFKPWNFSIFNDIFIAQITNSNTAEYFLKILKKNELEIQDFSNLLLTISNVLNDVGLWIKYAELFSFSDKVICMILLEKYKELGYKDLFIEKIEFALGKWEQDFDKYVIDNVDKNENKDLYIRGLSKYTQHKCSTNHYIELREYLTEEQKMEFINSSANRSPLFYVQMLEIEKKYSEILDFVTINQDKDYFSRFDECILPVLNIYPQECYDILSFKCDKAMNSYNRNRSTYQTMTGWLYMMLKIDSMKEQTIGYINSLYYHKPNLPALKDEFSKAGLSKYVIMKK
jgi:hypothetical protein